MNTGVFPAGVFFGPSSSRRSAVPVGEPFTNPVAGQTTAPTEGPGAVRLPGYWTTDLGMFKALKFTERFTGQFRFEAFNVFNHLNPICCASFTTSSSSYDKIRSARDPRILQLALKLNF